MKHVISIPTIILFLGVCALGLTSCVGDEAHDPQPPATALENEPTSVPETNQGVPVFSGAQPANNDSIKPPPASGHAVTSVPSFPPTQTNQASSAAPVIAVSKPIALAAVSLQPHSWLDSKGLFWLLNWLTLLVLLASVRQLRSRRQEKVMTASKVRRGENGAFEKLAAIHRQKEIAVTAFFKSQKHKMHFSPAATVKKVTAWAAYQCEIFDQDTMEVHLAIHEYSGLLPGTAHIGRFVEQGKHHLELDVKTFAKDAALVPKAVSAKSPESADNEILVQAAGMPESVKVPVKHGAPFREIISSAAQTGNFPAKNANIFLENETTPLNPYLLFDAKQPRHQTLHVHPQKEITVTVFFNGQEHKMRFSPSTTIKKVTAWAAYQFEIFDRDTTEVYLAIHGYSAPLTGTAHIGRFVEHDQDHLELDVMTFAKAAV